MGFGSDYQIKVLLISFLVVGLGSQNTPLHRRKRSRHSSYAQVRTERQEENWIRPKGHTDTDQILTNVQPALPVAWMPTLDVVTAGSDFTS